jgi:hypothetical protein
MFTNIKKINGKYVIEKRRYGQTINYGTFNTKEEALEQKKLLMKYNWIKNKSTGYDKEEHFPRYCIRQDHHGKYLVKNRENGKTYGSYKSKKYANIIRRILPFYRDDVKIELIEQIAIKEFYKYITYDHLEGYYRFRYENMTIMTNKSLTTLLEERDLYIKSGADEELMCEITEIYRYKEDKLPPFPHRENISYEEEALFLIAEKADGAMRDALSFTDSVLNFSPECISREAAYKVLNVVDTQKYFDLVSCLLEKDIFNTILKCNEILAEGYDVINLAYGLLNFFRNLLLSKAPSTVNFIAGPDNVVLMLKNFGKKIEVDNILTCISEINLWSLNYKDQINKKFSFEFLLFRLKKNIYCERVIIQNASVGETFVEKNEIKKTFDLNCLNVGEGLSESEENSQKKRSLLDVFEKEIALTNI